MRKIRIVVDIRLRFVETDAVTRQHFAVAHQLALHIAALVGVERAPGGVIDKVAIGRGLGAVGDSGEVAVGVVAADGVARLQQGAAAVDSGFAVQSCSHHVVAEISNGGVGRAPAVVIDLSGTQAEVAERIGTPAPAVARLERPPATGRHSPSVVKLRKHVKTCGKRLVLRVS